MYPCVYECVHVCRYDGMKREWTTFSPEITTIIENAYKSGKLYQDSSLRIPGYQIYINEIEITAYEVRVRYACTHVYG